MTNKNYFYIKLNFIVILMVLSTISFSTKANAQGAPWEETSACGTPLGMEHGLNASMVIGFDDQEPWSLWYSGALPGDLSNAFTIDVKENAFIPWWQQASDWASGVYPAQMTDQQIVFERKPMPLVRIMHPAGRGIMMEPAFEHLDFRDFKTQDESWLDFIAAVVFKSDYNSDGILGDWSTDEQPMYVACLQKTNEIGQNTGVVFPLYGRVQNKYSAGEQLLNWSAHMFTNRFIPVEDRLNDPSLRFRKTANRETRIPVAKYTPKQNVDCGNCESWGGYLCNVENKRTTNIREDCANGQCKVDPETRNALAGVVDCILHPLNCAIGDTYSLYAYSVDETPYAKYRSMQGSEGVNAGDFRFANIANMPDRMYVQKRFEETYHVSKKRAELSSGVFTVTNPAKDFNILHKDEASEAAGLCALWRSFSTPCYKGSRYCFPYLGANNTFANEQPVPYEPDPNVLTLGSLSKFCLPAERGITNIGKPIPPPPPPPTPNPPPPGPGPGEGDFVVEKTADPEKIKNEELDKAINWKIKIRAKYNSTNVKIDNKTLVFNKEGSQIGELTVDDSNKPIIGWTIPQLLQDQTYDINYVTTATKEAKSPYNLSFVDTKVTDTVTVDAEKIEKPTGGTCGICGILGKQVKDKGQTWNDNGLVELLVDAGSNSVLPNGQKALVPGYVLAGIITWEGPEYIGASKENITAWSASGAKVPGCTINSAGAQGPFQLIVQDWDVNGWSKYKNAVVLAGKRASGYQPDPCNLMDAAYAAAAKLRDSLTIFDSYNTSCEAYDEEPAKDCSWTKNNVIQATCHYYGRTGDGACSSVDVNEDGTPEGNMCYSARATYYQELFICK